MSGSCLTNTWSKGRSPQKAQCKGRRPAWSGIFVRVLDRLHHCRISISLLPVLFDGWQCILIIQQQLHYFKHVVFVFSNAFYYSTATALPFVLHSIFNCIISIHQDAILNEKAECLSCRLSPTSSALGVRQPPLTTNAWWEVNYCFHALHASNRHTQSALASHSVTQELGYIKFYSLCV